MEPVNQTAVSKFFLLGLTDDPKLQPVIFILFLFLYLITILGNLLIILAVSTDSHLHTPMYFFLSNLSFTDICISTTTIPKMLVNNQAQNHSISYTGCISQICFVLLFGALENCLLAVMAYDRYVAICHPLMYMVILNQRQCVRLVLLSVFITTVNALLHSLLVLRLSFCTELEVTNFFCELIQVIKLSCNDSFVNNLLVYLVTSLFAGVPVLGIIFSYTQIVSSILRIPSVGGRHKSFSTCGSHLSVVSLFYGTIFGVYMSSAVSDSSVKNAVASMMYIVIPQLLNPFIYSLRNGEIQGALTHLFSRIPFL
ncbi:olfactory receptor 7G2 [Fukomys damarensis]|uniref:Olfactory receptor n=1 Tax=Fukomys damarensis TaxID=885580 RepID=A0A091CLF2_FUKDA|nr:olfactory receptor 7G2 [Fukomys damarensis]KFO19599.1 Olfactory receptor 7G1 [Fukomys damarensis]